MRTIEFLHSSLSNYNKKPLFLSKKEKRKNIIFFPRKPNPNDHLIDVYSSSGKYFNSTTKGFSAVSQTVSNTRQEITFQCLAGRIKT